MTKTLDKDEIERSLKAECERSGQNYDEYVAATLKGGLAALRLKRHREELRPHVEKVGPPYGDDLLPHVS